MLFMRLFEANIETQTSIIQLHSFKYQLSFYPISKTQLTLLFLRDKKITVSKNVNQTVDRKIPINSINWNFLEIIASRLHLRSLFLVHFAFIFIQKKAKTRLATDERETRIFILKFLATFLFPKSKQSVSQEHKSDEEYRRRTKLGTLLTLKN